MDGMMESARGLAAAKVKDVATVPDSGAVPGRVRGVLPVWASDAESALELVWVLVLASA